MAAPLPTRLPLPYDAWFASKADRGAPGTMLEQGSNHTRCWAHQALVYKSANTFLAQGRKTSKPQEIEIGTTDKCNKILTGQSVSYFSLSVCPKRGAAVSDAQSRPGHTFSFLHVKRFLLRRPRRGGGTKLQKANSSSY